MSESRKNELYREAEQYVRQLFPSYADKLDAAFVRDIVSDVMETSAYGEGCHSSMDISLGFQRVVLGRMGCPDWSIYYLTEEEKEDPVDECKRQRRRI